MAMKARMLRPGFWINEDLGSLPPMARLLFAGLWGLADREGRLEDRPRRIASEVFPYDAGVDVAALLDQLVASGFVHRYEGDGRQLLWLPTFLVHQRINEHEAKSKLPACPLEAAASAPQKQTHGNDGACTEIKANARLKGREGKLKGREEN